MILQIYRTIHTLITLVAIFTGLVVVLGMLGGKRLDGWTKCFLSQLSRRLSRDSFSPSMVSLRPSVSASYRYGCSRFPPSRVTRTMSLGCGAAYPAESRGVTISA